MFIFSSENNFILKPNEDKNINDFENDIKNNLLESNLIHKNMKIMENIAIISTSENFSLEKNYFFSKRIKIYKYDGYI